MTASLGSIVNTQAPPSNPNTPNQRTNPEHEWYVALQAVRMTATEALDKADQYGPEIVAILNAVKSTCSYLTTPAADAKVAALSLAAMALETIAPQLAAQAKQLATQLSAPTIAPAGGGAPSPFGAQAQMGQGTPPGLTPSVGAPQQPAMQQMQQGAMPPGIMPGGGQ